MKIFVKWCVRDKNFVKIKYNNTYFCCILENALMTCTDNSKKWEKPIGDWRWKRGSDNKFCFSIFVLDLFVNNQSSVVTKWPFLNARS